MRAIASAKPANYARIDIKHTYRGDLTVRLGAGNPADPDWVTTISDQEGQSIDNLALDVDIGAASSFLPPSASKPWFLEVTDNAEGDTGLIEVFSIRFNGMSYGAISLPVHIADLQTSFAYIGATPPSCQAHIDIQHTWRGDLIVKLVSATRPARIGSQPFQIARAVRLMISSGRLISLRRPPISRRAP